MKIKFHIRFFYNLITFLLVFLLFLYIFKAMTLINILNFLDMLMSEHKLPVQISKINDIKTNHVNFAKADENRIFK